MKLRKYQKEKALQVAQILEEKGVAYLAAETRTGKTYMALEIARLLDAPRVVFFTPPKAQGSIYRDHKQFREHLFPELQLCGIHALQSIHKATPSVDLVVIDEAHKLAAFAGTPNKTQKAVRKYLDALPGVPVLLMSATPTAEGPARIFRQFWAVPAHPWSRTKFWAWVHQYIDFEMDSIWVGGKKREVPNFSKVREADLEAAISPYMVFCSQEEAGFNQKIIEKDLVVEVGATVHHALERLETKKTIRAEGLEWPVPTPMARFQKAHQLAGGSAIYGEYLPTGRTTKDGRAEMEYIRRGVVVLDHSKAEAIRDHFPRERLGIYYKFREERQTLEAVLGPQNCTDSPEDFEDGKFPYFLGQVRADAEGVRLASADALVFYSWDYSATLYWQTRNRLQVMEREDPARVFYLVGAGTRDADSLRALRAKKDFTLSYYREL